MSHTSLITNTKVIKMPNYLHDYSVQRRRWKAYGIFHNENETSFGLSDFFTGDMGLGHDFQIIRNKTILQ